MIYLIVFGAITVIAILIAILLGIKFGIGDISQGNKAGKELSTSKGDFGERKVAYILGDTIPGQQYVINDMLFDTKNGNSCQIDHIYINTNGIWVIETKNYSGRIYGNLDDEEWIQVLAYGQKKHKFYNPVKQNSTHIRKLSEYLGINNIFHNIICFSNNADLSCLSVTNIFVIGNIGSIKTLQTGIELNYEQMEFYYNRLLELKNSSRISKEEHISRIIQSKIKIENGICPRCGGRLILRNGKYGNFYGCSNYPKCNFKKNIDNPD